MPKTVFIYAKNGGPGGGRGKCCNYTAFGTSTTQTSVSTCQGRRNACGSSLHSYELRGQLWEFSSISTSPFGRYWTDRFPQHTRTHILFDSNTYNHRTHIFILKHTRMQIHIHVFFDIYTRFWHAHIRECTHTCSLIHNYIFLKQTPLLKNTLWTQTCLLKHTHIRDLRLGRHCEEFQESSPLLRMREEELSRSLRGGSGVQFPTLIPSSCLSRLRKRTHSFVWFRSVFSPGLPRNQIARNSSRFLVYTKVYSWVCVYDVTHACLSPNRNEIYWLTHTYTHTHRYACYQGQSRTHEGPTLHSS